MKWSILLALMVILQAGEAFGSCEYMNDLADDEAAASALHRAIDQVRPINDDPLAYKPQGVDDFSVTCLACHGGNLLSGWNIRLVHSTKDASGSHRIGTNYVSLAMRGPGLQEPEMLDPRIVLAEGRVGCLSCHDPFNLDGNHLVMSNSGSRLCLSCHKV